MYLKQLTLRGFKSFASATTLAFEPGITCVVGPNGSGKSNVVDALSWVMGEQGAKSLRGGKMEDVIFAGTSKRAPLGRAEVELTIDNSDGALPIEYSEVTITRTMFRSGGSDYSINGTPARLLDVQELLSDSGIGREMHVIVGQGQLDAILQATPESRRGFIEEAAGVLKHRKRKEKALRKLEGTKANLERLQDLIGELARQLKPLGRQAETARKAAVIQVELRDARARLLADDLGAARQALAADLADEAAVTAAKDRAQAQVRAATQSEDAAELALRQTGAEFDASQEAWYAAASLRERVSTTLSVSAERMRAGANQPQLEITGGRDPEQLEREATSIREREAELGGSVDAALGVLQDATLRRNAAEKQHAAADAAHAAALRAVADRREGLARLTGQVQALQSRLQASQEEVGRLQRRHDDATQRAQKAATTFTGMASSLSGLGASESDLDEAHEAATALVDHHQETLKRLRVTETTLGRDKAALTARIGALRLMTERKDASAELVTSGAPGVRGRLIDSLQVESGWERAVSAALQSAAESVVVEGVGDAVGAVHRMATMDMGRATLVVTGETVARVVDGSILERVGHPHDLAGTLALLLGSIIAVETLEAAHKQVEQAPETMAVTRDGDVVSTWLVEGGSAATPSLLELTAQLTEAEESLERHAHEQDRTRLAVEQVSTEIAGAKRAATEALSRLHASDAELAAAQDRLGQLRQTQTTALREAERLTEAMAAAARARVADEEKLTGLQDRLTAASSQDVVEPDPVDRDDKAMEARRARQSEMDARLALRTWEEQAKALAGRAEGLLRAAQAERSTRAKARAKAEQLRREAEVAATVHAAATRLADLVDALRERASLERSTADAARRDAEAATVRARHDSRTAAAHLEELVRGAHRDEMTRIEHRMRIEQLEEKVLAELGMEPDPLLAEYGPDQLVPVITRPDGTALGEDDEVPEPVPYDRAEQATRLRRAERNLTVLGRVNPLALEEFDAMRARHGFLAEQLDDLKRTRTDLMELIDEVDKRVKEVFEAAYKDVEDTFVDVFGRLFPGGEGRLVLTDPGNWLTTGVDVEARPAGKQVKRLSLLSGGERSLVAVAFLVSLFIARPSPFYILDEVEAALDDANLGRLLTIYEELRTNSQLLIITHQKRTMEIADSLYGVTMRGDGISTVVSQRMVDQD